MKNPGDVVIIGDRVILVLSTERSQIHRGTDHACLDSSLVRFMVEGDDGSFTNGLLRANISWTMVKAKVRQTPLKWSSWTATVCKSNI